MGFGKQGDDVHVQTVAFAKQEAGDARHHALADGFDARGAQGVAHRIGASNTIQVPAFEVLVRSEQPVDDDQLVEPAFGKPLEHRGGEGDVLVVIELDFSREHTNALALVHADWMLRDLVLNQGHGRKFGVQHRSLLLQSKGTDDVGGGDDAHHTRA